MLCEGDGLCLSPPAGYSCHYKRRTGRKTDGCCTCFKAERFALLAESHVEFFRPAIDVLNRDNVGLVLLLQPRPAEGVQDATSTPLCVVNTHLLYNPRRGDIKLAQLALLLAEVEKLSRHPDGSRCPIILCGDLNATPDSPLYQLLYNGVLNYSGLPAWKVSGQERYCTIPIQRLLCSPLWPDFLGISASCQYITHQAAPVKGKSLELLLYGGAGQLNGQTLGPGNMRRRLRPQNLTQHRKRGSRTNTILRGLRVQATASPLWGVHMGIGGRHPLIFHRYVRQLPFNLCTASPPPSY